MAKPGVDLRDVSRAVRPAPAATGVLRQPLYEIWAGREARAKALAQEKQRTFFAGLK